jgi:hypothetical protein
MSLTATTHHPNAFRALALLSVLVTTAGFLPATIAATTALDNYVAAPGTSNDDLLGSLSVTTGSVVAMVGQIPNQPLRFFDEEDSRSEDALLAYGMDKYLLTGDPQWLVHFPMTKAVVRAMDTVQQSVLPSCGSWWVTFSCTGNFMDRVRAYRMLDAAELALATGKQVNVWFRDDKMHNGYCLADRLDVIR